MKYGWAYVRRVWAWRPRCEKVSVGVEGKMCPVTAQGPAGVEYKFDEPCLSIGGGSVASPGGLRLV